MTTMIRLRVEKSPVRQFLAGVAGLVLVIAAIDIVWLHQLSGPPTENTDGTLTSRGIVERRTDVLWGTVLLGGGSIVLIGSIGGLAVRRPVVELTDDELRVRVGNGARSGSPLGMVSIPWDEVVSVRSATDADDGWQPTRVLVLEVTDPTRFPAEPWGSEWVGEALHIDADGWQVPAEEVALRAQMLVRRNRALSDDDPAPLPAGDDPIA